MSGERNELLGRSHVHIIVVSLKREVLAGLPFCAQKTLLTTKERWLEHEEQGIHNFTGFLASGLNNASRAYYVK
jgi:hypothetical protein